MKIPLLFLNQFEIKQVSSKKSLEIQMFDTITWEQQITLMQNEIPKNLAILFKLKKKLR